MKSLTVQILVDGQWQDAAELTLSQPERGAASPTTLGYNLDYALRWMERDDEHACSLNQPAALPAPVAKRRNCCCAAQKKMPSGSTLTRMTSPIPTNTTW